MEGRERGMKGGEGMEGRERGMKGGRGGWRAKEGRERME